MNVLVVAAHPDDETLGVGGTICRHVDAGDNVYLMVVCESVSPRYKMTMVDELKRNTLKAADILRIKEVLFFDFPNIKSNTVSMLKYMISFQEAYERFMPDIIYTHHRGDVNVDHRLAFEATITAARSFGRKNIREIYCYEVVSSTEWAPSKPGHYFMPNTFVDVTKHVNKKMEALKIYKSEIKAFPHPRSLEAIRLNMEKWAMKVNIDGYVEPLITVRNVK